MGFVNIKNAVKKTVIGFNSITNPVLGDVTTAESEQVVPIKEETPAGFTGTVVEDIKVTDILPETSKIRTSLSGLNSNLIAHISATGIGTVEALVIDGTLSQESTWSTPFENSNPENRAPSLLGALQSGVASDFVKSVGLEGTGLKDAVDKVQGRSSFTKVNSTQIYVSSQSAQIQLTLLFSAWTDARAEVERPIGLLQQMSAPVDLAEQGLLTSAVESGSISIETFFPSVIPPKVTLKYGGRTYKDLILQSFNRPLSGVMDGNGNLLQAEVTITLVGYQAWDGKDVKSMYGG